MTLLALGVRLLQVGLGFWAVWLVCMVEEMTCGTAYGGPFTILLTWILKTVIAGLVNGLAMFAGLFLLLPGIRDFWRRAGHWSVLAGGLALALMVFASHLGLRTVQPVSNARLMPFWLWCTCLFWIAFPIVNFPVKWRPDA